MEKSKLARYTLLAVFIVPLLIAMAMFFMRDQLSFFKSVSHGELIHPAQPIAALTIQVENQTLNLQSLQGKWTYLLIINDRCSLECEAALFKLRQSRLATGRDINRVQSVVITQSDAVSVDPAIMQRHPGTSFGSLHALKVSEDVQQPEALQVGYVYLIDPLGNLMMKYDTTATSKGMLKDIKKLLKISNIG